MKEEIKPSKLVVGRQQRLDHIPSERELEHAEGYELVKTKDAIKPMERASHRSVRPAG